MVYSPLIRISGNSEGTENTTFSPWKKRRGVQGKSKLTFLSNSNLTSGYISTNLTFLVVYLCSFTIGKTQFMEG